MECLTAKQVVTLRTSTFIPIQVRPMQQRGKSLLELLVVMGIMTAIANIGIPSFGQLKLREQSTQQTNQLVGLISYSRQLAVVNKRAVTLCGSDLDMQVCSNSAKWQQSIIVFFDTNQNGKREPDEPLLRTLPLELEQQLNWSSFGRKSFLIYQPNGTTKALNGTFTLCYKQVANQQIVISLNGRVRSQAAPQNTTC